jgi:hypothetical protein
MPGPVSDSHKGPSDDSPYVPSWCFPNGKPKMCPCGHHEGYHGNPGDKCVQFRKCGCTGLSVDCFTTDAEFYQQEE